MSRLAGFAAMSGSRPQHLLRRNGTYYLRVRVPTDLQALVGLSEVRRTLGVHVLSKAKPIALKLASRVLETFVVLQQKTYSKNEARLLVQSCFAALSAHLDHGFVPETDDPERELAEQENAWIETVAPSAGFSHSYETDHPVCNAAKALVRGDGKLWNEISQGSQQDILGGVGRAYAEAHRLFLFRLADTMSGFEPNDPLFRDIQIHPPLNDTQADVAEQKAKAIGPTVGEVVDHYLKSEKANWTGKTYKSRQVRTGYLVDFMGAQKVLSTVTTADVRAFSEALLKFRNRNTSHVGKSFSEKQTDNPAHRIAPATAKLIFITIKAFFNWATVKKGYIERNPAGNVTIDAPKTTKKAQKARRPFSAEELKIVFSAPLYQGCKSVHRRLEPGKHIFKDDTYWIPLVGYFTGMRLGEIVQLHVEDVVLDGEIPHFSITDLNSGDVGSDIHKSVKSEAGVRKVPVHPELLDLGFGEFIARRKKEKHAASKRLFWKIAVGADGQASTVFSKWFGRFLDSLGLPDSSLVFHSFRHNAEDAFRNALLPQPIIDGIIGHSDDATSAG